MLGPLKAGHNSKRITLIRVNDHISKIIDFEKKKMEMSLGVLSVFRTINGYS